MNRDIFWQFVKKWDEFEEVERLYRGNPSYDKFSLRYLKIREDLKKLRADLEDHESEGFRL